MDLRNKQTIDLLLGRVLLVILRIPTILLGNLLQRDHSLDVQGDILVIKMQGGGSLVLAFPALLGIRRRYPGRRMLLLTTPSVAPFAATLRIFDEILPIQDVNLTAMIRSAAGVWWRTFRIDTVIDLEVYSRLTTVYSVLTAARNRIGFFLEGTFWRRRLHTHLVFFNRFSCVCHFYEKVADLLGAPAAPLPECADHVGRGLPAFPRERTTRRIVIGHACSEIGRERMLTPDQWLAVFVRKTIGPGEFLFLGGAGDRTLADRIIDKVRERYPASAFENLCGSLSLEESVACIRSADEFWGIDSALLHYARLLGKKSVSFWGPTDPATRLRPIPGAPPEEIYYCKVPCSPCVHVAETPPCEGKNLCIAKLFNGNVREDVVTVRECLGGID